LNTNLHSMRTFRPGFACRAVLLAAPALAQAPDLPEGWHLLVTGSEGTRQAIDSVAVGFLDDTASYTVRIGTFFPVPAGSPADALEREIDLQEYDCAGGRVRSSVAQLYAGGRITGVEQLPNRWQPVAPEHQAGAAAICAFLAQAHPWVRTVRSTSRLNEEQPVLANRPAVSQALAREYPRELLRLGISGAATVRMRVLTDGRVDAGRVDVTSASEAAIAEAARRVALMMRFRPARVDGKAVPVWVQLPIRFSPG
jgi:TonB family protein